ncbi:MAG TPA: ATP-binding protein [Patescibacteria group bacterium]|nr:ATP-binding protein [Patescibacteria group bacterium]
MLTSLKILIIDDDALDRMAIRRHLASRGGTVDVMEAETGAEGISLMDGRQFDCVFVDYRLPDMDGTTLLQNFYDVDRDVMPAPFVMLTGQGGESVMADALRWGAHDYVLKENINAATVQIALQKAREIFELKRARHSAEEKLRQAQKMDAVGQLTSGVAHDFNNLLTVILGNTRLIRRRAEEIADADSSAALLRKVDAVEAAARHGAELVRHLMVFSRQRELKPEILELGETVQHTVSLLHRTLGERIELKFSCSGGPYPVRTDVTLLESAVINIAVNARDAMPEGGLLTIDVAQGDNNGVACGTVAITDTGTGMPEHVRARIFEPFYTTKAAGEGTGLGLAMVYGFIRQSGGSIEVESSEGKGTRFTIYLPLANQTEGEVICKAS